MMPKKPVDPLRPTVVAFCKLSFGEKRRFVRLALDLLVIDGVVVTKVLQQQMKRKRSTKGGQR